MRQKGITLVVVSCIFWGFMGITSRNLSALSFDSLTISFFRAIVAGLFYIAWIAKKDRSLLRADLKSMAFFAAYGIITFGGCFISYNMSVARIPISITTVLMFTNPIWVMLIHRIVFKEKIDVKKAVVMALCISGCMLIAQIYKVGDYRLDPLGIATGLLAGLLFALQVVMPRFYHGDCRKDTMIIYGFIFAAISLLFFTDFKTTFSVLSNPDTSMSAVWNILIIGIFNTFIANTAYIKSTEYIDATLSSIFVSLEPVLASIIAYWVFGESLEFLQLVGMATVIGSVTMLEVDFKKIFRKKKAPIRKAS